MSSAPVAYTAAAAAPATTYSYGAPMMGSSMAYQPMSYSMPATTYGAPQMSYAAPQMGASFGQPPTAGASYVPPVTLDAKTIAEQQAQASKQLEEQTTRMNTAAKTQFEAQRAYLQAEAKRTEMLTVQQITSAAEQQCFELDWQQREQALRIEQEYQAQRASIISTAQALTAQAQQAAAQKAMAEQMAKVQMPGQYGAAPQMAYGGFPTMMSGGYGGYPGASYVQAQPATFLSQ